MKYLALVICALSALLALEGVQSSNPSDGGDASPVKEGDATRTNGTDTVLEATAAIIDKSSYMYKGFETIVSYANNIAKAWNNGSLKTMFDENKNSGYSDKYGEKGSSSDTKFYYGNQGSSGRDNE